MYDESTYDLIVVGAGSGGIGAALTAGRLGLKVLLVEKQPFIGGNAAQSGVSIWEMGVGGTGIPFDIYKRLKKIPEAVGIYRIGKHRKWQLVSGDRPLHPGAEIVIDPSLSYRDSLLRHGSVTGIANEAFVRENWHGVPFEPAHFQTVVEEMLAETENVTVVKNTVFRKVFQDEGCVVGLLLDNGMRVSARFYIDGTDSGFLCGAAGSTMLFGQESKSVFGEPDAPEIATERINGVSLIYRITNRSNGEAEASISDKPPVCWWAEDFPVASIVQYPNGDFNVNMLPTMDGNEFRGYADYREAYQECRRRVLAHFAHIRHTYPPYSGYHLSWIAPALGVREGRRVETAYILTEHDLLAGISGQKHDDCITIVDHPMDTHGKSTGRAGCSEMEQPYGVPYRCLIPKGFKNLLIASRAAGFSSLAASSCRLSRTMMQLGQAAGTAAWLAACDNYMLPEVPPDRLRRALRAQHVQLEFPLTEALNKHLADE